MAGKQGAGLSWGGAGPPALGRGEGTGSGVDGQDLLTQGKGTAEGEGKEGVGRDSRSGHASSGRNETEGPWGQTGQPAPGGCTSSSFASVGRSPRAFVAASGRAVHRPAWGRWAPGGPRRAGRMGLGVLSITGPGWRERGCGLSLASARDTGQLWEGGVSFFSLFLSPTQGRESWGSQR